MAHLLLCGSQAIAKDDFSAAIFVIFRVRRRRDELSLIRSRNFYLWCAFHIQLVTCAFLRCLMGLFRHYESDLHWSCRRVLVVSSLAHHRVCLLRLLSDGSLVLDLVSLSGEVVGRDLSSHQLFALEQLIVVKFPRRHHNSFEHFLAFTHRVKGGGTALAQQSLLLGPLQFSD